MSFKQYTLGFIPTYHRMNRLDWIHAVHPRGSFPCLHYEQRRMRAHALIHPSVFHHSRVPRPRFAGFGSCWHLHLFGLQRGSLTDQTPPAGLLCFHSAPVLPTNLANKMGEGRKITPMSHFKWKQLTYIFLAPQTDCTFSPPRQLCNLSHGEALLSIACKPGFPRRGQLKNKMQLLCTTGVFITTRKYTVTVCHQCSI